MHDYLLQNNVGANLILVDTHADALRLLASGQHDYALLPTFPASIQARYLSSQTSFRLANPSVPSFMAIQC